MMVLQPQHITEQLVSCLRNWSEFVKESNRKVKAKTQGCVATRLGTSSNKNVL